VIDTTQGTYTVTITNAEGCKEVKTIKVTPDIVPLTACCNSIIIKGNDTIMTARGAGKYLWQPSSSLNCDTCATVIASPTVTTTYTVIGTDSLGCQVEELVTIVVESPCFNFIVPNVFTPTYSGPYGENNEFYIKTQDLDSWSILIYDRWGKEMYSSTNPTQYWNGTSKGGGEAPAGVYYYVIDATCQGNTYKKNGFVQLIR
jgi:gliding motility-associated-like protein